MNNNNIKIILIIAVIIIGMLLLSEYSISKKENDNIYKVVYHNKYKQIKICGEEFIVADYITDDEILLDMLLSNIEDNCTRYKK